MSHQKPCLHGKWQAVNGIFRCVKCGEDYVPNPNGPHANAPKPPEAAQSKPAPAPEPPDYRYGPFGDGVRSPEPKQGSACCEECKRYHRHFRTDCCKCRTSFGPSDIPEAEPKQGSEEPIDWGGLDDKKRAEALQHYASLWLDGALGDDHRELCRAYLAIRAEVKQIKTQVVAPLRARLAEVSKAAMAVVSNSDMATPPTIAAMAALEAILAKGDGK